MESPQDRARRIWVGDWEARLHASVRSLGCASIADFLARFPAEPYTKVVQRLGDDLAAFQLTRAAFVEAKGRGRLREAARDCLARELAGHVKRGWGRGLHIARTTAGAYAAWVGTVEQVNPRARPHAEAVWRALETLPPPEGWIPTGADDPILLAAFAAGWPVE